MRRLNTIWVKYLNYFGLAFAIYMIFSLNRDTQKTNTILLSTNKQQEDLRDLLWVNLLMQRSMNFAYTSLFEKNSDAFERSLNISESISPYLENLNKNRKIIDDSSNKRVDLRSLIYDCQITLREIKDASEESSSKKREYLIIELSKKLDGLSQHLNTAESNEWFALREQNRNLVANIERKHSTLAYLLTIFVAYLLFLVWVSSRKEKAELALRDSEVKLASAAKMSALGEMAGGVAHEINTPLATISLTAEQLLDVIKEGDHKLAMEMINKISKTANRISAIVQGLRTFSRDGSEDSLTPTAIKEIIDNTLALCNEKIKQTGVELSVDDVPPALMASCRAVQISQILLNLLSNACDAIYALPEKWIRLSVTETVNDIKISVTDSGPGIDKETLEKLFQPFFTTKAVGKGTGLGLSIAKGIAEAHKGNLYVDSSCKNTRFVLRLPKAISKPNPAGQSK